ncbi:hypothetical protein AO070_08525 [Pseudomonas syringae pv. syringae PD2766]|nr:hypothetical protein AO070_08525 [Pseudomonas syringae pv. syringae PD2766]
MSTENGLGTTLVLVPTLRVVMHFVTLCLTRFCDIREIQARLKPSFRPSASYFDGAKVTKTPCSCFRPDFVGFLRPARLPPDQRQDSAVTNVALCVVSAIAIKKALL